MSDEFNLLSEQAKALKAGRYKDYEGREYQVLGCVKSAEDNNSELVVYKALQDGKLSMCPLSEFLEEVEKPKLNYKGPRFVFIG